MALHILVVEDDATVLTVLVAILEDAGFMVTATNSGLAMQILTAEKPAIDAVVLDCRMPGEPSAQLALQAKSLRLPVVMISGHIETMQFAKENSLQLLPKPFRTRELLSAVSKAIGSGKFGQRDA
jgi:two-component system response regulator GlrR